MRLEKPRELFGRVICLRIGDSQVLAAYDAVHRIRDLGAIRPDFVEQTVRRNESAALAEMTRTVSTLLRSIPDLRNADSLIPFDRLT